MFAKLSLFSLFFSTALSAIGYIGHVTSHAWVHTEQRVIASATARWNNFIHVVATARGYQITEPEALYDWRIIADQSAQAEGLDRCLVRAIIAVETGHGRNFVSPVGALGHMQLMPATAKELGITNDVDRMDPVKNIPAGTAYLRKMTEQFGLNGGIAAYNAGPGSVGKAMAKAKKQGGHWLQYVPAETRKYVPAVESKINECDRWS